jgi:hypothetical protein
MELKHESEKPSRKVRVTEHLRRKAAVDCYKNWQSIAGSYKRDHQFIPDWHLALRQRGLEICHEMNYDTALGCLVRLALDMGLDERDILYMENSYKSKGQLFLTEDLPKLGKSLEQGIMSGSYHRPEGFRAKPGNKSPLPDFLWDQFKLVFHANGDYNRDADMTSCLAVQKIRQIAYFLYKAPFDRDIRKDARVIESFIETERSVTEFVEGLDSNPRLDEINHLNNLASYAIDNVMDSFEYPDIRDFRHGPGATADELEGWEKDTCKIGDFPLYWENFQAYYSSVDHWALSFWRRHPMRLSDWTDDVRIWLSYLSRRPSLFREIVLCGYMDGKPNILPDNSLGYTAAIVLVEKDSRGPRLISKEPTFLQLAQQGYKQAFYRHLESHPLTGGHVNFTDQKVNQELARLGSINHEWSTLDLKDASDRVSCWHVKALFAGRNKPLYERLMGLRSPSTSVEINGKTTEIELKKYAPMGSALCFPVLATTVWAYSVAAIMSSGVRTLADAAKLVYVYGDDIVVATNYANRVVSALELVGLRVNREKSFIGSDFCESCGSDWFRGYLVTPIRLKDDLECVKVRKPVKGLIKRRIHLKLRQHCLASNKELTLNSMLKCCATARRLDSNGYRTAAGVLYTLVEHWLGQPLPYSHTESYLARWASSHDQAILMNLDHSSLRNSKSPFTTLGGTVCVWVSKPVRKRFDLWLEGGHINLLDYFRTERIYDPLGYLDGTSEFLPAKGEYVPPRMIKLTRKRVGVDDIFPYEGSIYSTAGSAYP